MAKIIPAPPFGNSIEVSADVTIHIVQMEERIAEHRIILVSEEQARELCVAIFEAAEELGWQV